MKDATKNDIAPLSRPPRDVLEQWQEIHKDDWKALLRSKSLPECVPADESVES
jgi:hypothetical protein